jgi:queuosine precursor transporter
MTVLYLAAVVAANLTIAAFGAVAVVPVSFLFVGFVMTTRDHLHDSWLGDGLPWKMSLLVVAGGALSFALNADALTIAVASSVAFAASETANALVYQPLLRRGVPWLQRVNIGNLPNATIDSLLFVTLAFGFAPAIIAAQIAAKVVGGFVWSLLLQRLATRRYTEVAA